MKRYLFLLAGLMCGMLLPDARVSAAPRCFPDAPGVHACIDDRFKSFWEAEGGLPVFGYPLGPATQEQTPAGTFTVQHFERTRLELHPENRPPYDVLLGRIGAEALTRQGQ